jgi:nitrogen fixation protein FixH
MTSRWHWGVSLTLIYVTFASGTLAVVTFALRQRVDLVSADYYARSLTHDAQLAAVARVAALGDSFVATPTPDGRAFSIGWPPQLRTAIGTITLYRPADASADRVIAITPDRDGRQTIALTDLASGAWTIQIDWSGAEGRYYAERRVIVR